MRCAACDHELSAFTGDVCPECQHFAHPTRLGIYDRLELIKRGGMGSVYRARHPELGTIVAIKTVHTHTGPETLAERFEQEARLAARIPHPGAVRVFDYDCQEGRLYLVMEHVDGETLRPVIERGSHDLAWRLDKMAQVFEILHAAHGQGIVHRDIKPENLMVDSTGRVRVLDFGISRVLDDGERLTQTGEILGTPEYIAPEQILDVPEAVDPRTDIYAAGVVLYELLTGRSPFAGSNLFQVLKKVESLDPPPPDELVAGIDQELSALTMECMAKERERRPTDAGQVARRLRAQLPGAGAGGGRGRRSALRMWAAMVAGVLLGLGSAAFWPGRGDAPARAGEASRTPAQTIRAILDGEPPFDRGALVSMSLSIGDGAGAEDLYWRARARQHCGALLLALRDFEAALALGHEPARSRAAVMWAYKHKLLPLVLGEDLLASPITLDLPGDDALARCFEALARNDYAAALTLLPGLPIPAADLRVLSELCRFRSTGKSDLDAGTEDHLPLRMLGAALVGRGRTRILCEVRDEIDRLAPMRYLVEAAIACRGDDPERLSAALELATVTGEAELAMAVFVAAQLRRYDRLDVAARGELSRMAEELRGPTAAALRQAVEKRDGRK